MEDTSEKNQAFPINQKLLEEASKLKEERKVLKERLDKIEQNRTQVTPSVYQRVHHDYAEKLKATTDALLAKKQDIDAELSTLYETSQKIEVNLKSHQETLEELQFRQQLGEYDQEEFHTHSQTQKEKIKKFETLLSGLKANIGRYESLFEGEADFMSSKKGAAPSVMDVLGDEDKEAEDYFHEPRMAPPEWTETTQPQLKKKKGGGPAAELTLVAGNENVGQTYSVADSLTLGRSNNNDVILRDAKSSRQHAEITRKGDGYILTDLHSSNGTYLNGEKMQEAVLNDGDEIQIGDHIFKFKTL